jgi:hypothetical protein
MSDEKDFKKKFKKSTEDIIKKSSTKLYPVSNKDIEILKKDTQKESGTNTYAKDNQAVIKKLKA